MTLTVALLLVWIHFLADFIFQADKVALAKGKDNKVLVLHVTIYIATFIPFALWYFTPHQASMFLGVNWLAHFVTDYISSRLTTKLYQAGERHWFFVVIGADQALHFTALFLTFAWLASTP